MTRQECEQQIMECLEEIMDLYKKYNPHGEYLAMFCSSDGASVNNEYWEGGDDEDFPIRANTYILKEDDEK